MNKTLAIVSSAIVLCAAGGVLAYLLVLGGGKGALPQYDIHAYCAEKAVEPMRELCQAAETEARERLSRLDRKDEALAYCLSRRSVTNEKAYAPIVLCRQAFHTMTLERLEVVFPE